MPLLLLFTQRQVQISWEEARVVRQVFEWVGRDRCSIGEIRRHLEAAKERTRTGKAIWDRATIGGMLHNSAHKGEAAFGKTMSLLPATLLSLFISLFVGALFGLIGWLLGTAFWDSRRKTCSFVQSFSYPIDR